MAITEVTKIRIATALVNHVHNCEVGMRRGARDYFTEKTRDETSALSTLTRAVNLPLSLEAGIRRLIEEHGSTELNKMLSLAYSETKISDLETALIPLKTIANLLKENYQNNGWTTDQLASYLMTHCNEPNSDEEAILSSDYVDKL